ncbi:TetR/AcrR family transcriptional regulator [Shouchella lehensis]|uniref:Transcriptional regulator, TetR family protein n=1 Tax=Shouchella lehensis G1 TaxID=1246626 RepID=A0A060LTC6_9BACI|nr:TetR/AcrR family transcriptional regulator [Shouchella lehensis]AIC94491.1 transcriptional regulator, TetR family protein [Shouchella lehensis G1]
MGNKEQTYQDIMETAFKMFSKKGFDQTSLTNIATEVGISKPAIYYYFKSKDELIKTLFDTLVKDIQSVTLIKVENMTAQNVKELMYDIGEKSIDRQEKERSFNQLFNHYILLASRDAYYADQLVRIQHYFFNTFYDALKHAVQINAIKDEAILIKSQVLALLFDNITNYILTGMELDYKKIWKEAVDNTLRGIE